MGVLFGLTDFCYWLYVTDLGVDRDYEGRGIGTKLMRAAHELAGGEKDIALYLVANEKAVPFYQKLGMTFADDTTRSNGPALPSNKTEYIQKACVRAI